MAAAVYHAGHNASGGDVFLESLLHDVRYALRGIRRSPLFAFSVAATIGLGLGVLCSAFTILNAYVLKPVDLPEPYSLYELSWDTATVRRQRFRLADLEAMRESGGPFLGFAGMADSFVTLDGTLRIGQLVTEDYFQVLGAKVAMGRTLTPSDAPAPGGAAVVILSDAVWRTRVGADPAIVGQQITLGRGRFDVVGVAPPNSGLPGAETVAFWAPLTMARAFGVADPWSDPSAAVLSLVVRLRPGVSQSQARAWFDNWLRQRFQAEPKMLPVTLHVDSRATRIPLTGMVLTLFLVIVSAFGLVLLIACANVTNLVLARGFSRQREIGVRLSLGGSRRRVVRQLIVECLVLALPAALVGLGLTYAAARAFPALIAGTFPVDSFPLREILVPATPDVRVVTLLSVAAIAAAVLVSFAPALRVTRANLVRAAKGEESLDPARSRLRTSLVVMQIGACALFLVSATSLIDQSRRFVNPTTELTYERVSDLRVAPRLRADVAARLQADPSVELVAAAWRTPMSGPLRSVGAIASETRIEQAAGFMVVSPEYFPMFDVRVVQGRAFTKEEAEQGAAVALVSRATAKTFWPNRDPIGQTLELVPSRRSEPQPDHTSVRIIGVTEDVTTGLVIDGVDTTIVYFPTDFRSSAQMAILVRGRGGSASVKAAVAGAIEAIEPDAGYQLFTMVELLGVQAWMFQAFSSTASFLGVIGLVLAFSGTYAVVAFLATQRTREFGIRMALGATVRGIVSRLLGETLRVASVGLGAGLVVALALMRVLSGTFPIIPAFSLRPFVVGTAIVLSATAVAALLPSLRATRIDPSRALRAE